MLKDEMDMWLLDSLKELAGKQGPFGVFVDMRTLKPLPPDAQEAMVKGQQFYRHAGMARSIVILDNVITTMQFIRLAKESGIYKWERYIDASHTPNWEQVGLRWGVSNIDPDSLNKVAQTFANATPLEFVD